MAKLISFYNPYCLLPHRFGFGGKYFKLDKFFLSFGDTFLYLLGHFNFSKGQTALLPDFYCPETLKTIGQRVKIIFYRTNRDFSVDKESYFGQIRKHQPEIIINYAFTGFSLDEKEKMELKSLVKDSTVIIEDAAHRLITDEFMPLTQNHFLIDSVRKHSSFTGSHLLGSEIKLKKELFDFVNLYKIKCLLLQSGRNFFDFLTALFGLEIFSRFSDHIFLAQDAIIGEHPKATRGCLISFYLYQTVDWKKVKSHRRELAVHFSKKLKALDLNQIKSLDPAMAEISELNYLPIFAAKEHQAGLLEHLTQKKIMADILWEIGENDPPELNRPLYQSFIIYPLTWFTKKKDIDRLIGELADFNKQNHEK